MENPSSPNVLPWSIEWAWLGGYSSLSTLVIIFDLLIIVSVAKNMFLHYSFHYVVVALSLRLVVQGGSAEVLNCISGISSVLA
jgi:energy-converting hydrogenase Eha subunit H